MTGGTEVREVRCRLIGISARSFCNGRRCEPFIAMIKQANYRGLFFEVKRRFVLMGRHSIESMVLDGDAQGWRGIPGAPPASASRTAVHASLRPCPRRRWDQSPARHWATATRQSGQETDEGATGPV